MARRLSCRHHRRALAAVEAALVLPLLALLMFGLLTYGLLFLRAQQVTGAARRGARVAARADATNAEVLSAVDAMMLAASIPNAAYSTTLNPADIENVETGQPVTITVNVIYAAAFGPDIPVIPTPANLSGSVTMAKEGT